MLFLFISCSPDLGLIQEDQNLFTTNPSKSKICSIHQIWKAQNKSRSASFSVAGDSLSEWPGFLSSATYYKGLSEEEFSFINSHRASIDRAQNSHTTCSSVRLAVLAKKNENFTCYGSSIGKKLRGAGTGTSAFDREINEWKPALMRIMLGTNEIYAGVSLGDYEATLRYVLDELMHKHGVGPFYSRFLQQLKITKSA